MEEPRVGRHSLLRRLNHGAVLEQLARSGERSRVELSEALTLSQASVSRIVDKLLEGGLIEELAPKAHHLGRPQVPLTIRPAAARVATVDVRRDCYRLRLADLAGGLLAEAQAAIGAATTGPAYAGCDGRPGSAGQVGCADDAVDRVSDLLAAATRSAGGGPAPTALVVGVSAAWDEGTGRVYAARNVPYLEGVDLRTAFSARAGLRVTVENDVRLAALGELEAGATPAGADFYYLSLGSGVAGAEVRAGAVHHGSNGFAGELGYLRQRLADGGWTDLETVLGRAALEARWREVAGDEPLALGLGRPAAGAGEEAFRAGLVGAVTAALAAIAAVADPPVIVLGGSLGIRLGPLLDRLREELAAAVPSGPALVVSGVGADGALVGGIRRALEIAREELLVALLH